jgi:DMSO/TMAO reductase YedYZ heme-binding membrane subunit
VLVVGIILNTGIPDPALAALRLSGLLGFLSLCLGAIIHLARKNIKSLFGRPFIKIHHLFVISGLILITIHPVILALAYANFSVFIPDTSSVSGFLTNGGRIALILIYIGFLASIFRSVLRGRWIEIHRIMYPALVLGIIHANLIGEDLADPIILVLFNGIAGVVLLAGIIKIFHRLKK